MNSSTTEEDRMADIAVARGAVVAWWYKVQAKAAREHAHAHAHQ
jgi:hypothetical protein